MTDDFTAFLFAINPPDWKVFHYRQKQAQTLSLFKSITHTDTIHYNINQDKKHPLLMNQAFLASGKYHILVNA